MADKITLLKNVSHEITFKYDDCKYGDHPEYGKSYSYTVAESHLDEDGETVSTNGTLRCYEALHDMLVEAGAGKNATVRICKKEVQSKSGRPAVQWVVKLTSPPREVGFTIKDWDDGNILGHTHKTIAADTGQNGSIDSKAPNKPQDRRPPATGVETVASLGLLYRQALVAAHEIWADVTEFGPDNLQGTATTLFLEARRAGIRVTPESLVEEILDTEPVKGGGKAVDDDGLPF